MSLPIELDAAAEEEIRAAIAWYEGERETLGGELWAELQRAIDLIRERPKLGNIVRRIRTKPPARRLPLRRFPYFVIYRQFDQFVQIVALAHMSRRPGYWRSRVV